MPPTPGEVIRPYSEADLNLWTRTELFVGRFAIGATIGLGISTVYDALNLEVAGEFTFGSHVISNIGLGLLYAGTRTYFSSRSS